MTLLTATSTVIDHCKSSGHENDRQLQRAISRLEKRLRLLQLRHAKTLRWNRRKAFWVDIGLLDGGCDMKRKQGVFDCPQCKYRFDFGDFLKSATITGHGRVKTLICPKCNAVLIGKPQEDEI